MMNLCSDPEEQRNLKLNECLLVTDRIREAGCSDRQGSGKLGSSKRNPNGDGGGTSTSLMPSSWDTPSARDLVTLPVQGPGSIPSETSTPLPGSARPPEKSSADRSPAPSVTPKEQTKYLKRRGETRKGHLRSDGRTRGFNSQRLLSSTAPEEEEAQLDQRPTEFSGSSHLPQVPQKSPPLLSGSELSSDATRKSVGSAVPSAEATKLTTREDLSYARAPASGARTTQKRQAAPAVRERPPPSLNAHPGSGPGAPSLLGEGTQGPSPIDYNLEIEADFPPDMVLDMQRSAAQKAHKTVIGRTLEGRASYKDLLDCLKLHLLAPFSTITLLTRGYFEILFEDEDGAIATRKLAAVEWSGWALSFSKYSTNFRPNEQGAELLLTHSIKVQFPDLHV
ncbi:unnamed protein product [Sphagnum jensenii]